MISILSFVLVIGVLVFIHELGHFIVAKKIGAKVEEFALGFGPAFFKKKYKDTIYRLNILPIGGYIKIFGENDDSEMQNSESFASKTPLKKAAVLVAGVTMNFLLAVTILIWVFVTGFKPLIPNVATLPGIVNTQRVEVVEVVDNSPAKEAGIKKGDIIISINNKPIYNFFELIKLINASEGKLLSVKLLQNTEEKEVTLIPKKQNEVYQIGVITEDKGEISAPLHWAIINSFKLSFDLAKLTVIGFFELIVGIFSRFTLSDQVVGPVGIAVATGTFAQMGASYLFQLIAIMSLSLAIINIMPIPALDGGHLFILGLERLFGKEIGQKYKNYASMIGFALLMLLMIAITWKDFIRFIIR